MLRLVVTILAFVDDDDDTARDDDIAGVSWERHGDGVVDAEATSRRGAVIARVASRPLSASRAWCRR